MALEVRCGVCAKRYRVDEKFIGKRIKCKHCGSPIAIAAPVPVGAGVAAALGAEPVTAETSMRAPAKAPVRAARPVATVEKKVLPAQGEPGKKIPRLAPAAALAGSAGLCLLALNFSGLGRSLPSLIGHNWGDWTGLALKAFVAIFAAGLCLLVMAMSARTRNGSLAAAITSMCACGIMSLLVFLLLLLMAGMWLMAERRNPAAIVILMIGFVSLVIFAAPALVTLAMLVTRSKGRPAEESTIRLLAAMDHAFGMTVLMGLLATIVMDVITVLVESQAPRPGEWGEWMDHYHDLFFTTFQGATLVVIGLAAAGLILLESKILRSGKGEIGLVGLVIRAAVVWVIVGLATELPLVCAIWRNW